MDWGKVIQMTIMLRMFENTVSPDRSVGEESRQADYEPVAVLRKHRQVQAQSRALDRVRG